MTSIGRYNTDGEAPDSHLAILGLIEYGIGGVQFKANFDWKVGTQFSIAASFVRLSAAFSEVGETAPSEILVAAMMASGSRAARSQVTRSYPQLTVVDGGNSTVLFPVPPLAHALNLFSPQPKFYEAGSVVIRYVGGANQGISTASTSLAVFETDGVPFLSAMSNEDGMRFPETARWVEVSYGTSEVVEFEFTPCFTLSL